MIKGNVWESNWQQLISILKLYYPETQTDKMDAKSKASSNMVERILMNMGNSKAWYKWRANEPIIQQQMRLVKAARETYAEAGTGKDEFIELWSTGDFSEGIANAFVAKLRGQYGTWEHDLCVKIVAWEKVNSRKLTLEDLQRLVAEKIEACDAAIKKSEAIDPRKEEKAPQGTKTSVIHAINEQEQAAEGEHDRGRNYHRYTDQGSRIKPAGGEQEGGRPHYRHTDQGSRSRSREKYGKRQDHGSRSRSREKYDRKQDQGSRSRSRDKYGKRQDQDRYEKYERNNKYDRRSRSGTPPPRARREGSPYPNRRKKRRI
jgi:hypothetical protein